MPKADHMLAILWLLKSRKRMTAAQLAEELEIHVRTVYRCIDALCVSGVPIISEAGRSGGYRISDHFRQAPLFFDPDEQKALVHAAAFAREAGYPFGEALNKAVSKLKRYSTPEQLSVLERHESGLEVIHPPAGTSPESVLGLLEMSIAERSGVRIEYRTGYDDAVSERDVDPYGLVHWKSKWYVVGYCRLRTEVRSFRVDRIRKAAPNGAVFERPAAFSARQFLLGSLLPDYGHEDGLVSVHIAGNPQALDDLCGHWLFGHALAERSADSAHFRMDELTLYAQAPYHLLSYGGKIRILEPAGLKECLAEIAESLLEYYKT
ncbi:helix-turn-helix transcriptional regulator [Paenibacillus hamazuiensis]|uniref:helix-turn-helix transcriptional regulator n=1 Tax=Paenibacillus hamazuiensis TaxID=2936508 RepID=UPI00200F8EEC|nr:YafY family protein [Paenibacillus hamazuiensis]